MDEYRYFNLIRYFEWNKKNEENFQYDIQTFFRIINQKNNITQLLLETQEDASVLIHKLNQVYPHIVVHITDKPIECGVYPPLYCIKFDALFIATLCKHLDNIHSYFVQI